MGSQLLRMGFNSPKSFVERVIASLQQLKHADAARHAPTQTVPSVTEVESKQDELRPIGLAISGGVDSMALASLCSHLQSDSNNAMRPRFRAFVVDHGVRATSKDEADSVAKILESKNIPTSILKIQWPSDIDPKLSPKFESLARTYRFQALGRACRDHNINSLFLAHHKDDQAETLLMRLVNGHGKRGLMGMKQSAPIPECHGIYGVDRSGGSLYQLEVPHVTAGGLEMESGGVMVHRPLLNFTKAQLRQHCERNNMPWFEDLTNADPKVTMRNAIRHIYANHKLPLALQKPSLLAMLGRLKRQKEEAAKELEEEWSSKIQVRHFDLRLPLMIIDSPHGADICDNTAVPKLVEVLKNIMQRISSVEDVENESLVAIVLRLFPQFNRDQTRGDVVTLSRPPWTEDKFNASGVQFTRFGHCLPIESYWPWILTAEKAYRNRSPCLRIEPISSAFEDHMQDPDNFQLYDGRYWVNIFNQTSHTLSLQHLGTVEASNRVNSGNRKLFRRVKAALEKGSSKHLALARYGLPTLAVGDGEEKGRIVAFPTFGITDDEYLGKVKYVVRYRNLGDFGNNEHTHPYVPWR